VGEILNEDTEIVWLASGRPRKISNQGVSGSVGLARHVKLWPTPTVQDSANNGGPSQFDRNSLPLNAAVKRWPTPTCDDADDVTRDSGAYQSLTRAVRMWTTPVADDTGHRKQSYSQGGTALSSQAGGTLNPTWVEWLMGFPEGWTDFAA
jgi:hypothetical protein